jgi:8-oxo-dGTP pyrophosphatase MutT (NUDIX family)
MSTIPVAPRPASTVVLLREAKAGPQVLLLQRPPTGFAADAWVFPGGTVDPDDYRLLPPTPEDPARWAARLDLVDSTEAWGFVVAALRETWEETGLLLGKTVATESEVHSARRRVLSGIETFAAAAASVHYSPASNSLIYLSRWITPHSSPRRYDTRFFLARVNARSQIKLEGGELLEARWVQPETALAEAADGKYHLMTPTVYTLRRLIGFDSADSIFRGIATEPPRSYLPHMRTGPQGVIIDVHPLDPE